MIPLSQRFDASKNDIKFSGRIGELSTRDKLQTKIKNLFTQRQNERARNHMRRTLENLSGYRIRTGFVADGMDAKELSKVIRSKKAYDLEKILPEVGRIVAQKLNLTPSAEMNRYIFWKCKANSPRGTTLLPKNF